MSSAESCDEFLANNWKKDLCINCQRHVSEHKTSNGQNRLLPQSEDKLDSSTHSYNTNAKTDRDQSQAIKYPSYQQSQATNNIVTSPVKSRLPTRAGPKPFTRPANNTSSASPVVSSPPPKPKRIALVNRSVSDASGRTSAVSKFANKPLAASKPLTANKPFTANKPSTTSKRGPVESKPFTANKPVIANKNLFGDKGVAKSGTLVTASKPLAANKSLATDLGIDKDSTAIQSVINPKSVVGQGQSETHSKLPISSQSSDTHYKKPKSTPVKVSSLVEQLEGSILPISTAKTLPIMTEDTDSNQSIETLRNTLMNVNVELDEANLADYGSLQDTFEQYKDYREHLHESSFHKLTEKVKHHHHKHQNGHHNHPSNGSCTSDATRGNTSKAATMLQPTTSLYDNAMPNLAAEGGTSGGTPTISSPKYDLVAKEMASSTEYEKPERIYAEVNEEFISSADKNGNVNKQSTSKVNEYDECSPITTLEKTQRHQTPVRMLSSLAEYEELGECVAKKPTRCSKSQTMPNSAETKESVQVQDCRRSSGQQHVQQSKSSKMAFLKTFLKKGKKSETAGHSTGQRLESLEAMPALSKDRQMAVVDDWVKEQNSTNKLDVVTVATAEKGCRMHHSDRGIRGSISPTSSIQRPDKKPPPPPTGLEKASRTQQTQSALETSNKTLFDSTSKSALLLNNNNNPPHNKANNSMILTKDKNGDYLPSPIPATNKQKTETSPVEGLYDAPWEDVDSVISSILKSKMEKSVAKAGGKGGSVGKQVASQPKPDGSTKSFIKKLQVQHSRQISLPDQSRNRELVKRSGKMSPTSATDSGYESTSTITTISRGHSSASDLTQHRLGIGNAGRATSAKSTPLDSVSLCLEQIGGMNNISLQKLAKAFSPQDHLVVADENITWSDVSFIDRRTPSHHNSKCAFYKAYLKGQPSQPITIMLSLKEPVECKTYSPNQFVVSRRFSAEIEADLLPSQMLKAFRSNSSQNGSDADSSPSDKDCGVMSSDKTVSDTNSARTAYITLLPYHASLTSVTSYMKNRDKQSTSDDHLAMDSLFIILQVISIIFSLAERQKQIESLTAGDLVVSLDSNSVPTVYCHMVSVRKAATDFSLICEKLKMFLIQLTHTSERLTKLQQFKTVEDLIQNSTDAGDLKTIALIIQYLLWGPKTDEVKVMTAADNKKQAFELWLHLSRGTLLNQLLLKPIDKLKTQMMTNFLTNTSGPELFKIAKLLGTY